MGTSSITQIHYKLVFKGYMSRTFTFTVHKWEEFGCPESDQRDYISVKEDGYLYIQGVRITNNRDGINTIYGGLTSGNMEYDSTNEAYVDTTYSIDMTGYVIQTSHNQSPNKVDRLLCKLFG